MIVIRFISGLGNQLFQYALGRQLALKTGQPLKYDLGFFKDQGLRKFTLDRFETVGQPATQDELQRFKQHVESSSLHHKIYRNLERRLPLSMRRYFREKECWDFVPEIFNVSGNIFLEGYWQSYRYFQSVPDCLYTELRVKKELHSASYVNMLNEISGEPSSVSIHIRRSDYVTNRDVHEFMGVLPIDYYKAAIARIKQQVKLPVFYFFSDDLAWAKENFKGVDAAKFVDLNGGATDYLELELMSKCRHNIIANSTFSWWGAFLNRNPEKLVIGPQNWVRSAAYNQKIALVFPDWIKL